MQDRFDVVICGAGIAGASLAWQLMQGADGKSRPRVLLLERESQPGFHSTGRSAAMFMESYGPPQVRALTRASRSFYSDPPHGFADVPLLHPRGVLYVASREQHALLDSTWMAMQTGSQVVSRITAADALARVPCLRTDWIGGAIAEADAMDLDVHALHQGFLRGARAAGVVQRCDAELLSGHWHDEHWRLGLAQGELIKTPILVNAAGAWADELATRCQVLGLGLEPRRRSAFTFAAPEGASFDDWPAVCAIDETWYFKPDAGQLLGSPANADPTHPHDVQPEALDIAMGIHGIEQATHMTIRRPRSTWAGLRTFAPDGEIVIGFDGLKPGFFWLAGQGGYGLQSAAGAAQLAAALLRGDPLPSTLVSQGVTPIHVSPARFTPT